MPSSRLATTGWLGLLALLNVGLLVLVGYAFIGTIRGQMLDTVVLAGNGLGHDRIAGPLGTALDAISSASVVLVLVMVGLIAVVRRRYSLAVIAVMLVAGSTLTTYVLKMYVIARPDFGVDPERAAVGNSLPSGHATAAAAFAVGLVLVLPRAARGVASLAGATYAAVVGVATLSSGWHRLSDIIAAYLVVGGWAAASGLMLVVSQRPSAVVSHGDRAGMSLAGTLLGGLTLLGFGLAVLSQTAARLHDPVGETSPRLLTLGYVGSVLTIAGAAYLMMAVVLSTIHEVVPYSQDGMALRNPADTVRLL